MGRPAHGARQLPSAPRRQRGARPSLKISSGSAKKTGVLAGQSRRPSARHSSSTARPTWRVPGNGPKYTASSPAARVTTTRRGAGSRVSFTKQYCGWRACRTLYSGRSCWIRRRSVSRAANSLGTYSHSIACAARRSRSAFSPGGALKAAGSAPGPTSPRRGCHRLHPPCGTRRGGPRPGGGHARGGW